ncbi:MAG: Dabb family protein [Bacteroidales bacterium]
MIKHIVFFRFPGIEDESTFLPEFKERIEELRNKIPEIAHIEAGLNFSDRETAFDIALVSEFNSREDLDTYRTHPDHLKLIDFLNQHERELAVVDYEY